MVRSAAALQQFGANCFAGESLFEGTEKSPFSFQLTAAREPPTLELFSQRSEANPLPLHVTECLIIDA